LSVFSKDEAQPLPPAAAGGQNQPAAPAPGAAAAAAAPIADDDNPPPGGDPDNPAPAGALPINAAGQAQVQIPFSWHTVVWFYFGPSLTKKKKETRMKRISKLVV